jgi:2-methylcitrate dehydratase
MTHNLRPDFDKELLDIADYVLDTNVDSHAALATAETCFKDSLACALLALHEPTCTPLLGAVVPDCTIKNGARVPGTQFELDPVRAAFNIGTLIRWLDYNDTWLAAEWGHPSDNLGGILAVADFLSQRHIVNHQLPITMRQLLIAMIKAYEIQGIIGLENSFNAVGLDHVVLVKVATIAVIMPLFGASREQLLAALSLAWVDGQSLRTYRHAPNTGSRKSWAAGDATARAVQLALMVLRGEAGYPSALSAPQWGFYDSVFKGQSFKFSRNYGTYVMENILFKIYPAEFHAQTAVEGAIELHKKGYVKNINNIEKIFIETQAPAMKIINKTGKLYTPADRDHCLQYMVAVALLYGELRSAHYHQHIADDPRIDQLRAKMHVEESVKFTRDYYKEGCRSITNAIRIICKEGKEKEQTIIREFPLGHPRMRAQSVPLLREKFLNSLKTCYSDQHIENILLLLDNHDALLETPVNVVMDSLIA